MGPEETLTVVPLLNKINAVIINPIIIFLFVLAAILFIIGLLEFFLSPTAPDKREQAKRHMLWGVLGVVIMISVYGIIALLLSSFGVAPPEYLSQ